MFTVAQTSLARTCLPSPEDGEGGDRKTGSREGAEKGTF